MLLLSLARKFWPHAIGALVIGGGCWYLHHSGYKSGYSDSEKEWRPRFEQAGRDKAAADARAAEKDRASAALSRTYEERHAQTVQDLTARIAASDGRVRGLVRELSARSSCQQVSTDGGASAVPDAAAEVTERADRAAGRLNGMAGGCEADAEQVKELQRYIEDQRAIINSLD